MRITCLHTAASNIAWTHQTTATIARQRRAAVHPARDDRRAPAQVTSARSRYPTDALPCPGECRHVAVVEQRLGCNVGHRRQFQTQVIGILHAGIEALTTGGRMKMNRPQRDEAMVRKAMTDRVDDARERIGVSIFSTWDEGDFDNLVRLMRKFAEEIKADSIQATQDIS